MGSVNRYGNFGIEYAWVKSYFAEGDEFWTSEKNDLGKNMKPVLRKFLSDAEVTTKNKISPFGLKIAEIGIDTAEAWALLLCNAVYTAEFNWWMKNISLNTMCTSGMIETMLGDDYTANVRRHIVSAYKNTFASNDFLSKEIRFGVCDYTKKGDSRHLNSAGRETWDDPDPRVILYSLYKFAEKCDGYYQFTLARLLNHEIESEGISPTEIFGLDRSTMEKLLSGLAVNYPEFISVSFSIDLDNISLKSDKTSLDVLSLF
jgi:phosphoadenosine phosphosulfate reductase